MNTVGLNLFYEHLPKAGAGFLLAMLLFAVEQRNYAVSAAWRSRYATMRQTSPFSRIFCRIFAMSPTRWKGVMR